MPRAVEYSPGAAADLDDEVAHLLETSVSLAERFADSPEKALVTIQEFPHLEPRLAGFEGVHRLVLSGTGHIVIYKVTPTKVRILSVGHGSRGPGFRRERARRS